jgi:hypothetical protein
MPLSNVNIHMYQEVIKIKVYKVKSDSIQKDFEMDDKTFIGTVGIMWKECPNKVLGDGTSKMLDWQLEMVDPEEESTKDITGELTGNLQWVKFGSKTSKFSAAGDKLEAKKAQQTDKDFKGPKVGEDGVLKVMPKKFETVGGKTIDLSKGNY